MIYKSYLLEKNIQSLLDNQIFLFYGENQGLKKEFKDKIKKINEDKEVLNLFQNEIVKNKDILLNEILNKSLFVEKKIIFIYEADEKILEFIEEIENFLNEDKIFIFAEILDKRSKLRSYFEKSKNCGVTACYQDNEITIKNIIIQKLKGYVGLTPQVINLILQNSGLDRNKINNEIDKITSFFPNKKIELEAIDQLLNIRTNEDFNYLKDAALNGNKINTNRLLADTVFEPENNVYYLNSINQRINKLYEIDSCKKTNSNIESLIANLKPPVFWKDKTILIEQAKKWDKKKIKSALSKTYDVEIKIKSNSSIRKDLVLKKLIVDLCSLANAS